mmetsp:Transcript_16630/g.29116  ORF Transcript_16630/g.29116 Transcript_16630/m.29116 type:complete len:223 (-) Transcript_16630:291-959(-)
MCEFLISRRALREELLHSCFQASAHVKAVLYLMKTTCQNKTACVSCLPLTKVCRASVNLKSKATLEKVALHLSADFKQDKPFEGILRIDALIHAIQRVTARWDLPCEVCNGYLADSSLTIQLNFAVNALSKARASLGAVAVLEDLLGVPPCNTEQHTVNTGLPMAMKIPDLPVDDSLSEVSEEKVDDRKAQHRTSSVILGNMLTLGAMVQSCSILGARAKAP